MGGLGKRSGGGGVPNPLAGDFGAARDDGDQELLRPHARARVCVGAAGACGEEKARGGAGRT